MRTLAQLWEAWPLILALLFFAATAALAIGLGPKQIPYDDPDVDELDDVEL